ncbi:MAG: serine/threonine protein kinase/formylglycine-generating enzyme required for sulfatase activity [Planctomycetota bacterium]|jgi:serine/threonine protein kinase/formylglycine-generating enzyme required for sulfatase activity
MTSHTSGSSDRDAQDLLIEFLGLSHHNQDESFEVLCIAHAEQADELGELYADHCAMQEILGVFGQGRGESQDSSHSEGARPGDLIGDFELVSLIARGGQGEVWEARQRSLSRRVALKLVLPYRISDRSLALFAREARAGGRLAHPGIVAVYGYGEDNGQHWIAQEFVEGAWTLRNFIDGMRSASLLPSNYYQAVALFTAELADALEAAHTAGVIHRDVKPQNVLVTANDHPKLTDFGLARIKDETAVSMSGELAGTWLYMSPEQVRAKRSELDHRTDIFSLGVVLYEMLTLVRPFDGDTTHQIAENIVHRDPVDIHKIRSRVPKDLAVICAKALEKARESRFQSMAEFAADLRRHLAHEPILARPSSRAERGVKWVRRNPTKSLVTAVAGLAFLVVSGLGIKLAQSNETLGSTNATLQSRTGELSSANSELQAKKAEAQANAKRADAEAADARKRTEEVFRLSLFQDHSDLMEEVETLWPVLPNKVEPLEAWLLRAEELLGNLPVLVEERDQLRANAIVQTEQERQAEREAHPDYQALVLMEGDLSYRRKALAVRRGEAEVLLPDVEWDKFPSATRGLDSIAWNMVGPTRDARGQEALGLALSLQSLKQAEKSELPDLLDTLAWAYFGVGDDASALEQSLASLQATSQHEKEGGNYRYRRVANAVDAASSTAGQKSAEMGIEALQQEFLLLEERVNKRQDWSFPAELGSENRPRWWHNQMMRLIENLRAMGDTEDGLLNKDGVSPEHGWSIARRLVYAKTLRDDFASKGLLALRWQEALPSINRAYPRLALRAQAGLVPIGPDPTTGLWEFWDVVSGSEPLRDLDGVLQIGESSGLVFVLLQGGMFWMGSQSEDSAGQNYDPSPEDFEDPVHQVGLSPFMMSKYEMSQAQWLRLTGFNRTADDPSSQWQSSWSANGKVGNRLHPVANITWTESNLVMERWGWQLPTEAQWEFSCRAGTSSVYWSGDNVEDLRGVANVADNYAHTHGAKSWIFDANLDDGYTKTAEVTALRPNAFGLHNMHGNVYEWCSDGLVKYVPIPQMDPTVEVGGEMSHVFRGGGFSTPAASARSSDREGRPQAFSIDFLGVRPSRAITE